MFYSLDIIGIKNKQQGFLIKEALDMVFSQLLDKKNTMIDVNVYVSGEVNDAYGLVSEDDDDEYSILLNESILDNKETLFATVAHEAVHITQYIKKDLIHMPHNKYAWKGVIMDGGEYDDRPWEHEAFTIEGDMVCQAYEANLL